MPVAAAPRGIVGEEPPVGDRRMADSIFSTRPFLVACNDQVLRACGAC